MRRTVAAGLFAGLIVIGSAPPRRQPQRRRGRPNQSCQDLEAIGGTAVGAGEHVSDEKTARQLVGLAPYAVRDPPGRLG